MKKILSLGPKDWMSGIAQGYHFGSGIWGGGASGINPFINAQRASTQLGLLQAGPAVTDLTASTVVDTPIGWTADFASNGDLKFYFVGTGTIYSSILSSLTVGAVSAIRTVSNMANGVIAFKAGTESKYLYYFQKTQIGRMLMDNSSPSDNWATGLVSTVHHPVHRFFDIVFYGNGTALGNVGSIRNASNTATHAGNELDIGAEYTITTLSDDGRYLVIGATKNVGGGNSIYPGTKILFWDTNSSSWEKEWDLPAPDVISIKKTPSGMYALTSIGLFIFNFDTPPRQVLNLGTNDTAGVSSTTGAHYSMDVVGDGVMWGSTARLHYYGKFVAGAPTAYHHLFSVPNGIATMVCASANHQVVIAGTTNPKFGFYNYSSGTADTGVSAESIYIDLLDRYSIERIDVIYGTKLATGDSVNIGVATIENGTISDYGGTNASSFANFGAVSRTKLLNTSIETENILIKPTFVGGSAKIKRIDVYGDKIET